MVKLTHPERILWEEPGITKQGLADFLHRHRRLDLAAHHRAGAQPVALPERPPARSAFSPNTPGRDLAKEVERIDVGTEEPMIAIDNLDGLLNLVQAGVVEIHPWGSRTDRLDEARPLIFDLDPGEDVPWGAVIAAAHDVRDRLDGLGLKSFVKTHGGKGLHVMVPITPGAGWDEAKAFTKSIAEGMAKGAPDRYVATLREEGPARADSHRLLAQRSRLDRGRRLFDPRLRAGDGIDPAHLGRAQRAHPLRSLHRRQSAQPAPVPGSRSLGRLLQDAATDSEEGLVTE